MTMKPKPVPYAATSSLPSTPPSPSVPPLPLLFSLFLAPFFLLFTSCKQDAYEKGTGENSLILAEMVEAYASAKNQLARVVTDEGVELKLTRPYEAKWAEKEDTAYRAVLYYNKVEGGADPVSCSQISTAVILPLDSFKKGVIQHPVRFESAWVSKTKRYLNVSLYLMTGEPPTEADRHLLAIADDSIKVNADGTRTQHLRLYHNRGNMPEYYSQRFYFSIPLHNVKADSVALSVGTYNGVVTRKIEI